MKYVMSILIKSVVKIEVPLKSDKNKGYLPGTPAYIYDNILLNSS